ncbi:ergothioneine biosynthesis protein EgtC [Rhodococcus aerolatus]
MCRHLAYLGPATSVAGVLRAGPTSLLTQSFAPRDMRGGGTVNADGWGVAWWSDGDGAGAPAVHRYRSERPMWTDEPGLAAAASVRSPAVLAAVRSATVGMPVVHTACAPFVHGRYAFSHNGVVRGWPGSLAPLAAALPTTALMTLPAPTDSAVLWALLAARLDRAGADPGTELARLCVEVGAAAPGSRLNLLLSDGATVWATTWDHALSVRDAGTSVVVASEPTDTGPTDTGPTDTDAGPASDHPGATTPGTTPGWAAVPDRSLVTARPGSVAVTPLEGL